MQPRVFIIVISFLYYTMATSNLSTPKNYHKIYYLDNLKVLLTILVIIHHAVITYGAPGSWYYIEKTTNTVALIFMTLFVATNQAFFMGLFFFISALFTEVSYERKGRNGFLKDKLTRLGIPLIFYSIILSPLLNYLVQKYGYNRQLSFIAYIKHYDHWIDFGVLWFVAALLLFTLAFVFVKNISSIKKNKNPLDFPSAGKLLTFAFILGIVSFIVRIYFPIGWTLDPFGFQLGHFSQYIVMFLVGIIAARNKWLSSPKLDKTKRVIFISIIMVILVFPSLYLVKELTDSPIEYFSGGWHWQSFLYSLWEQSTGISIMATLAGLAKKKLNYTSNVLQAMSRCAFGAYIFHPLMLILLTLILKEVNIDILLKLLIVTPCAVLITFLFTRLLVLLPGVNRVI